MTDKKPTKLWIFGDSWSSHFSPEDSDRIWTRQLAQRLSHAKAEPVQLRNHSLIGCAPDWITEQFLKSTIEMQPEDYCIIILTSPYRYWYFEDIPSLSNWNIIDFDTVVTKEQAQAVELYIKHIQRDKLDTLHNVNRLGNIAYECAARGLRRPMIIKGFDQDLNVAESYPDLNIAQGYLTRIQYGEYCDKDSMAALEDKIASPNWFRGFDCRYNHLCLSNHDILADKLLRGLLTNQSPDLTQGFIEDLIADRWWENQSLCQNELSHRQIEIFLKDILPRPRTQSWKTKTGIDKILG